ncbi:YhcN/YlaJ family sporulation lipoprotein [Bacillus gobiensis]|uniref:YhcN/YlaJ family sporulation lipoprotein n=1 Tax=Bacillus gobiensis TaxID=1441095 RepID=UPI003D21A284
MINKKLALSAILVPFILTAGCGMNNAGDNGRRDNNPYENVNYRDMNRPDNVGNDMADDNQNQGNQNEDNQMKVADEAADKVNEVEGVENATVIVTENNAFVAVALEGNKEGNITDDVKNKISDKVKSTDESINNVYVSANPDFFDRMQDYGNRINQGEPIAGFFDEFGETVRRVFPTAE